MKASNHPLPTPAPTTRIAMHCTPVFAALLLAAYPATAADPEPEAKTKPAADTKPTANPKPAAETKPAAKPAAEAKPAATTTERHGQVKFSSAKDQIVGDIVIRHDAKKFHAEITKAPGVPLLKLSAKFGIDPRMKEDKEPRLLSVRASGPLAHGSWTWRPNDLSKKKSATEKLKDPSRAWAALPEVFMWGEAQAKGEAFRVCLPDIVMHARAGDGHVKRFDYARHENPTGEVLPLKDLKKQPALETVTCHLD
jgi:hypothetical protein